MTDDFAFISDRTPADWAEWIHRNIAVTEDGLSLQKTPVSVSTDFSFRAVDIDLNSNGNIAVLAPSGEIEVYVRDKEEVKSLSLAGFDDAGLSNPSLIGTTSDEMYLIDRENGRVGTFSRRLRQLEWAGTPLVDPIAAVGSRRRMYVLDRNDDAKTSVVRTLGPHGRTEIVVDGLVAPIDLSIDDEETVYVIDERQEGVVFLRAESTFGTFEPPTEIPLELPVGFRPEAIAAQSAETLVLYGSDADGPLLVQYDLAEDNAEPLQRLDRTWAALLSGTVGDAGETREAYLIGEDGRVSILRESSDNQKDPETTRYEGRLIGRFDAGVRDVQWHRLTLDIEKSEPGTRVDVLYYASNGNTQGVDDFEAITDIGERQAEALRGADITGLWDLVEYAPADLTGVLPETSEAEIEDWFDQAWTVLESEFEDRHDARQAIGPEDMLLEGCVGRHLHVEIRLIGRRRVSPEISAITAYCPRRSYTRYLPEIYRERHQQSEFLPRYLSVFESVFLDIESTMEGRTMYLDTQEIPAEYLSWLGEWLSVDAVDAWPDSAQRELLERLPDLYKKRGTKQGIVTITELYLSHLGLSTPSREDALPAIERRLDTLVTAGYLTESEAANQVAQYRTSLPRDPADEIYFTEFNQMGGVADRDRQRSHTQLIDHPRQFLVLLSPFVPERHVRNVETIVESEKPVYTDADVKRLQERFLLGGHTHLNINAVLLNDTFEIGRAMLGQETRLDPNRTAESTDG